MEYKHIEVDYKDRSGYKCGFDAINNVEDIRNSLNYTVTRLQRKFNVELDEEIEMVNSVNDFEGVREILNRLPIRNLKVKEYNKYMIEGGKCELYIELESLGYKPDFENFINEILHFMEFEEGKDLYEGINSAYDSAGFDDNKRLQSIFDVLERHGYTIVQL